MAQVARLEKCLASLRRPGPRSGGMHPCAELVQTRVNTWAVYNEGLAQLRACGDSAAAALEGRIDLSTLPRLHAGTESVLCQTTARGPKGAARIEVLPEALAELVRRAADGQSREQLLAHARRLGAEPGEDQAILNELEKDLIVRLGESVVVGD